MKKREKETVIDTVLTFVCEFVSENQSIAHPKRCDFMNMCMRALNVYVRRMRGKTFFVGIFFTNIVCVPDKQYIVQENEPNQTKNQ